MPGEAFLDCLFFEQAQMMIGEELASTQPIVVVATAPATTNREVLNLFMSLNHFPPQAELPGLADPDSEFSHGPH